MALTLGDDATNVDFYAILPPCLAQELFDEDNFSPTNILLKFIQKINRLHSSKNRTNDNPAVATDTNNENATTSEDTTTDTPPNSVSQTQPTPSPAPSPTNDPTNDADDDTPTQSNPNFVES